MKNEDERKHSAPDFIVENQGDGWWDTDSPVLFAWVLERPRRRVIGIESEYWLIKISDIMEDNQYSNMAIVSTDPNVDLESLTTPEWSIPMSPVAAQNYPFDMISPHWLFHSAKVTLVPVR